MTTSLGVELGKVAHPAGEGVFDDVRLALVDALVAAKGAGRLGQDEWETVFGAAMRSLRLRVLADVESNLRAAAANSRYPRRRIRRVLPDAVAAEALLQRLLAAGIPLEHYEGFADDPITRRARAAALEASWEAAVEVAATEQTRWRGVAAAVAAWRRPVAPLWVISVVAVLLAAILAAWLSGLIASPTWFKPVNNLWWSLWP
ncbi:MAG: hypothetical protein ACREL5_15250 [Gemmatimonadales bacterium]